MTVSSNIAFNAALDLVDTFGPYSKDWPQAQKAAIKALEKSNPAFADHLTEMRAIEDQMSQWIEADDGVDVQEEGEAGGGGDDQTPDEPIPVSVADIVDMDDMLAAFIERQLTDKSHDYRVFTKDLDELTDISTRGIQLDAIQAATASAVGPLQKDITRLIAARTQAVRLPGQRRGRVHAPNLHRVLSGDDRVFSRKQEAPALDTAITILIDCSASMQSGGHTAWSQSAMSLAVRSAYALATVLNRVGVPFEVIGYTTVQPGVWVPSDEYKAEAQHAHDIAPLTRWTPLRYPRFKEFHEPFSLDIQRRFANVHDNSGAIKMSGTIEGCSVEFAARRLLAQSQKRKMLIVLSDGKPGGPVFRPDPEALKRDRTKNRGIDPTTAPYQRHAAEMVQEVTKAGIDIVGVGINYAEIKSYYPHAVVINDVKEMPAQLMSVLKKFLIQ